ncbi:hypothetical protein P4O66_015889, partial [Electrophorus voltai]
WEETWRRAVWQQNVVEMIKHNVAASEGQHTYTLGTNHLSDMTADEVNVQLNGLRPEHLPPGGTNVSFTFLSEMHLIPLTVDWTEKGLVSPVENQEGRCRYTVRGRAAYCSGFQILPRNNELALMHAVAMVGPVSVGINANLPSFHRYRSGIYNDPLCNSRLVNHAVLVVGYGTEKGQDYWLIKNSWGTAWGEKGFFRLPRNKNQCGVATFAIYPTL